MSHSRVWKRSRLWADSSEQLTSQDKSSWTDGIFTHNSLAHSIWFIQYLLHSTELKMITHDHLKNEIFFNQNNQKQLLLLLFYSINKWIRLFRNLKRVKVWAIVYLYTSKLTIQKYFIYFFYHSFNLIESR